MNNKGPIQENQVGDDEHMNYIETSFIDDSTWGKTSENQTIRQKFTQLVQKPKNSFIMDAISTVLNLTIISIYIIYLDRIHHFIDGGDQNKLGRFYLLFL